MSFLQPIALFGIALAATPILIHLINLMRHRRESWAAMRFLLKAKENSSRMSKIRRWLTLFCRVLAIIALAILLSRPMASDDSSLINFASQKPEVVMLVMDRSASMQKTFMSSSKTLLQRGLEEFAQFAQSFPDSKIVVIETVFSESDYLTLHIPAIEETKNLVNEDLLIKAKKGLKLINFARDEIVDSTAVIKSLDSGKLGGYVTDFADLGLIERAKLKGDVIILPHIGASTRQAEENCSVMAAG